MDIRVLRYFVTVAKEENITRAAESLYITQPSLSKQLMELEKELGKQLLIRGKRRITLTDDGVLLLKRAEEIIALFDKTKQELTCDVGNINGKISIGGLATEEVIQAASSLRNIYPGISFEFYNGDATDVAERLDHGSLDFAVLLEPVDTMKYEYFSLSKNSCWGLLMPKDCELAQKDHIAKEDLHSVPLIFHSRIGLQREITHWAETNIEQLNIAATYNILSGDPCVLVKSGLGYLLTSSDHLPAELDKSLCFKELFPKLELNYALVWKRNAVLSNGSQAFFKKIAGKE